MAAAGIAGADDVWMQREEFEDWLAARTRTASGRDDSTPGLVLVWRGEDAAVEHAAVSLGAGWALHKPSQGWMSPTTVLTVREMIRGARAKGLRLHRYKIYG
jgi:cell wall-associated NlpC family hydrolase